MQQPSCAEGHDEEVWFDDQALDFQFYYLGAYYWAVMSATMQIGRNARSPGVLGKIQRKIPSNLVLSCVVSGKETIIVSAI